MLSMLLSMPSYGKDYRQDSEYVRTLVAQGSIVRYEELTSYVQQHFYGRIIRTKLDQEENGWDYELRLLQDDGRIVELELDAKTLHLHDLEGEQLETVIKLFP